MYNSLYVIVSRFNFSPVVSVADLKDYQTHSFEYITDNKTTLCFCLAGILYHTLLETLCNEYFALYHMKLPICIEFCI